VETVDQEFRLLLRVRQ
jgi:hypothetical protein